MSNQKFPAEKGPMRKEGRKSANLSLNEIIKERGFAVARELGYGPSEVVEKFFELLWEQRQRIKRRRRGDSLQIELFDRTTFPSLNKKGK